MAQSYVVWLEEKPGQARKDLGRHTFDWPLEEGMTVTVRGSVYRVSFVDIAYCYVRPTELRAH